MSIVAFEAQKAGSLAFGALGLKDSSVVAASTSLVWSYVTGCVSYVKMIVMTFFSIYRTDGKI